LGELVRIDVTLNNGYENSGLQSTSFMKNILDKYVGIDQVMFILKGILYQLDLNENFKGGISSYSLFLMVTCYLSHHQIDFCSQSLGQIIIGFISFYEKFDYTQVICYN
jgi:DNA polymerase sigma